MSEKDQMFENLAPILPDIFVRVCLLDVFTEIKKKTVAQRSNQNAFFGYVGDGNICANDYLAVQFKLLFTNSLL